MTETLVRDHVDPVEHGGRFVLEEPALVAGRPVEDRAFEAVETGASAAAGLAIGSIVAGPVGTVVGGVLGAAAGLWAGERIERAAGHAAETMDAVDE